MKPFEDFRQPSQIRYLIHQVRPLADQLAERLGRPVQVMEICGGHTHTLLKYGLHQLLPDSIEFVHGPGCPVCVLPAGVVDAAVRIARMDNLIFTTFGDALRVPGREMNLQEARARGADVRVVYSPLDALAIARANPDKRVVFFGLGFETTMPATAMTLLQAHAEGIDNFLLFCVHITIMPTLKALLERGEVLVDGFIGPGHLSMVIGRRPYAPVARRYHRPMVIAGFEPADLLQSLYMLLGQMDERRCEIENQYRRCVAPGGNARALSVMQRVFEPRPLFEWRGLGVVPDSGVRIRAAFARHDAEHIFGLHLDQMLPTGACVCDRVLTGQLRPSDCPLFGSACTPASPVGALMVSGEGACAAWYQYARLEVRS
jgi:hydrogenase expression/formation protein HypD